MCREVARLGVVTLAIGALALVAMRPPALSPRAAAPIRAVATNAMSARAAAPAPADTVPDLSRLAPRDAWTWVRDNADRYTPAEDVSLVAVFFRQLAASDPAAVLAFADESLARADGAKIAEAAINALLENGRVELARQHAELWARAANPPAVGAAYLAVAWQLARDSDRAAADWLLALPASPDRDGAFGGVAGNWADHDPGAAMTWAAALPTGEARATALERAFRVWADHDADAAAQWLLANEAAPDADRLMATWIAASPQAQENPTLARQWTALIRDAELRAKVFAGLAKSRI